ncbi:MAG TPA: F0F1 ATP synthase subunit B [Acidimicrobiia bacterium]|nr:F0F1 ATP synthase subunit B [Acidimicrobiia bacterium]
MFALLVGATTNVTAKNPILPDAKEIIWTVIAFAIAFVILAKFAFPAVKKGLQAREDKIRGDLERAEQARTEAEATLAQYQKQVADARGEATRIIEEARQAAEGVRRDLIARAESDAADIRQRAQEDSQLASSRAMSELRTQVASLSVDLAEKIVEHNLDRDTQMGLIENYINSVGNGNGSRRR